MTIQSEVRAIRNGQDLMALLDQILAPYWSGLSPDQRNSWKALADALEASALTLFEELELDLTERFDLLLDDLKVQREYPRRDSGSIDLPGWLELSWDPAPLLFIADANHEVLPTPTGPNPFLSPKERLLLGLETYESRWTRDRMILESLIQCRAHGAVSLLVPQGDGMGEPRQPTSLLLRCDPEELPRRVSSLFQPAIPKGLAPAWHQAWRWAAPTPTPTAPEHLSVTAFAAFLQCPFRYYLAHEQKMQPFDPDKMEWDALDFGSLAHGILELWALEPQLNSCEDPAILGAWLADRLKLRVNQIYGQTLPLPVQIQCDSLEQRLWAFAHSQAALTAEGWEVERVEFKFHEQDRAPALAGLRLHGMVDRIDRNRHTGQRRIIDYKTADKAINPDSAHLRNWVGRDDKSPPPDYAVVDGAKKTRVWMNLQLPLYAWAMEQIGESDAFEVAYFNLPKAVSETGIQIWDTASFNALRPAALECATGIAQAIQARQFWPPKEEVPFDPFADIFFRGPSESVNPDQLIQAINGKASP